MQAENDKVVSFHYRVSEVRDNDDQGVEVETSRGRAPMAFLFGHGNIIPGLEQAIAGRAAGDTFDVTIEPEQAYGKRRDDFVQRVPKKYFRDGEHLKPGMATALSTRDGPRSVTVLKVGSSVVDVDLNHPLAGKTLRFAVEITDIRDATEEEIAHGHAHGPGGHH
ncbi:MAG: peptidylprolyl isomerase [Xanthomonadaceae bacterium]|nr:peptidylprolyl isomerase [Xanthomonadaceae bacterium]MDE1886123.1 peptidylprolyl isomerase [Xanthomonadaceae bacterium]MDE1960730.1 peptidylprolyl isomerase [Xanthomonadaceae bacterium]MDE2084169.1 peptidylprolyl isomerase [Xanthomonadaceae bacterium]MDE2257635.1 peptidylprolyl isomerase [Xanthomonadaceae bacterium]